MKRKRLTRTQRKDRTRECLLEAARKMFIEKGLAATSVEDIAETAGYTRGAFYSNFGAKTELLIELLRRDVDGARANLPAMMEEGGTPKEMKERVIAYYGQYLLEQDCFPLWVEAKLLARRDTEFRERINAFRDDRLDQVSAYLRMFSERNDWPLPQPADVLALGLVSLCDGVQFFRMCGQKTASDKVMQGVFAGFFSCALWGQPEEKLCDEHPIDIPD